MFAVLSFSQFPLQAVLRHQPESWQRPVVLVDPRRSVPQVIEATRAAREAGIHDGLTAPQALARCRELQVLHASPVLESIVTEAVLQTAFAFTPNLESTAPGLLTLDLRGLTVLSEPGGKEASRTALHRWAASVLAAMGGLGLRARMGLGETPNLAQHAACRDPALGPVPGIDCFEGLLPEALPGGPAAAVTRVLEPGSFVNALPVSALGPSSHVAEVLKRWGVHTVGEFLALGQAELADRLGLEALALHAAASVSGIRPLRKVQPADHFEERQEFEPPIETLEPLLFYLRRFVDALSQRLGSLGWVASTLVLRLQPESRPALEARLRLPEPTRRPEVLFRMLHTHLEGVRSEAPIQSVCLTAEPSRPEQRQYRLFEAALSDPHQFQETLARLAALVGSDRVGAPQRIDSHRVDDFRLVPPDFENASIPTSSEIPWLLRKLPFRRIRPSLPAEVDLEPSLEPGMPAEPRLFPGENLFSEEFEEADAGNESVAPTNIIPFLNIWLGSPSSSAAGSVPFEPMQPLVPSQEPLSPVRTSHPRPPRVLECRMARGRIEEFRGPWKTSGQWWEVNAWKREEWIVRIGRRVLRLVHSDGEWKVDAVLD